MLDIELDPAAWDFVFLLQVLDLAIGWGNAGLTDCRFKP